MGGRGARGLRRKSRAARGSFPHLGAPPGQTFNFIHQGSVKGSPLLNMKNALRGNAVCLVPAVRSRAAYETSRTALIVSRKFARNRLLENGTELAT